MTPDTKRKGKAKGKNKKERKNKEGDTDPKGEAVSPKLKKLKNKTVQEGGELSIKCEATGNPKPGYKWFKDGKELKKSKEIKIKGRKSSKLTIHKVSMEHAGEYTCEAENSVGKDSAKVTVNVRSVTTTLSPWSGHARRCNETARSYCVNGGVCYYIDGINQLSCKCPTGFFGQRCLEKEPLKLYLPGPTQKAEELYQKRVLTVTGICVALLVVGIVCVVAYCKTKKQRERMHSHMRQNMCVDHPNRNLANGPNHPGPGPEEIPMVDYISKNVPATERVIRHEPETSFSGSRPTSASHHSSTATHTSSHRNERTWSFEGSGSITSGSHSGMMTSSVGTSKCNSPACIEARSRRAALCCIDDPRRVMLPYRDSLDSLRDSPYSDRYVSALTTPARLSPVDLHYSLPTFEITSPNSTHATSLLPAAPVSFRVEEQHSLRRYAPVQDIERHDLYQQQRSYLNDSMGSLPSSPFRIVEDDEYETTQEYASALDQPKKIVNNNRLWKKSKLNGQISHRGKSVRDSISGNSTSDSDSEEDQAGESTPFLSIQNIDTAVIESTAVYRPADSRTYYSSNRHNQRENVQTRSTHTCTNQDSFPL
ncbi:pro-neuregulin-2, membrane-bound isoform isoform X2 [Protopterus annectens]|uniref:pro-neuregulin-2, membrane-bound isoform isoform X2 n=1 Tax=Protopterus annectens TaxID=7888 RepID=UPI001CFB7768|nr:pro-neuregulin-2, membrane-bound isoform isoform X2 [Protopterus annectens]